MLLQKINNRCGFTIIELMIVVAVIAICASIVIPIVVSLFDKDESVPPPLTPEIEIEENDKEDDSKPQDKGEMNKL